MLPLAAIAMLAIVQTSLLVWDQLRITHAAREGARVLAVTNDASLAAEAAIAASGLDPSRTVVTVTPDDRPVGSSARVRIRYGPHAFVPVPASMLTLEAVAAIRMERDP